MKVMLATLCLNEMEWLPKLYEQHKNWPGLVKWVFVEAADQVYAEVNSDLVSRNGLSVDGTSGLLRTIASKDPKVEYIPHGLSRHSDLAQGKCEARNRYLEVADGVAPQFIFVLDADEFYTFAAQERISEIMQKCQACTAFLFRQREIWRPPSLQYEPLLKSEVTGGYWSIRHVRGWRWFAEMRYKRNHNYPETLLGEVLTGRTADFAVDTAAPQCVHFAFASSLKSRGAKNRYYIARGEGKRDRRKFYVESRKAWETWLPGKRLPKDAQVIPYTGPIPEVFCGREA